MWGMWISFKQIHFRYKVLKALQNIILLIITTGIWGTKIHSFINIVLLDPKLSVSAVTMKIEESHHCQFIQLTVWQMYQSLLKFLLEIKKMGHRKIIKCLLWKNCFEKLVLHDAKTWNTDTECQGKLCCSSIVAEVMNMFVPAAIVCYDLLRSIRLRLLFVFTFIRSFWVA